MTIGVSNVIAAGSVQVSPPTTVDESQARFALHAAMPPASADRAATGSASLTRHAEALTRIEGEHRFADLVKQTDAALRAIGVKLEEMRQTLQRIIKQYPPYPPYPPESQERVELLNSISGLRKQIDALTVPPPNREPISLIGDPSRTPGAGDMEFTLAGERHVLHARPAHSGPEGLDLPVLGLQASDPEVAAAEGRVQQAQQRLEARRAALAEELDGLLFPRQDLLDQVIKTSRQELAASAAPITVRGDELGDLK